MLFRIVVRAGSPGGACFQEVNFGAIGPDLETGSEVGSGQGEVTQLEGLLGGLVMMPGIDVPTGDATARAYNCQQSDAQQEQHQRITLRTDHVGPKNRD